MKIQSTKIQGLLLVKANPYNDSRGVFSRIFCEEELSSVLGNRHIVQINHSRTNTVGSIRGLHYQKPPHAEMKMIRCLVGRVWDVAVDLRKDSPTFLNWHAEELSPDNSNMLVIPEGCAHGFQVLAEESELLYFHTAFYTPEAEGALRYDDPILGISWPLAATNVSPRDISHPFINKDFT